MNKPELKSLVIEENAGTPIVLLHGWGKSLYDMQPLGKILGRLGPVHLIDLPGFGGSAEPPANWGSADYAERIREYLDEHQIEQANLVGHSFGGKVSMQLASKFPNRIRKLVLIASSGMPPQRTFQQQVRMRMIAALRNTVKTSDSILSTSLFKNWFVPKFASADYKNAGPLRSVLVRTVNEDLSPQAQKISARTMLIWGEDDTETPLTAGQRLKQLIPQSTLISFPQKGHDIHENTGSHLLATYILPFLKGELKEKDQHV